MIARSSRLAAAAAVALASAAAAHAGSQPFDLAGPTLEVTVTRAGQTLPISQVPNLAPSDRLAIKADLPRSQAAPYLLVAAFLRGATNPPPPKWFYSCKTWTRRCAKRGITVKVPDGAEQVLVFLAPKTSGDFRTLVGAVRGQPGLFVRASQDLNQAMLDRSRLARYLAAVRALSETEPGRLAKTVPLLGRSLAIQVNPTCLQKIPVLQAACLLQDQGALILNDGHSTSIVEALTSGPASDLAMEASYTPGLRYGYFSPYVASILDIARILGSFATARYQYIPAIATARGAGLALTLSAAPSFHDPLSVLVTALPAVESPVPPPLHAVDSKASYCARHPSLVLPVEGAPLVFSTRYAHDMTLVLAGAAGRTIRLPAKADAERGGFVIDTARLGAARLPAGPIRARLEGYWGFAKYEGPGFELWGSRDETWRLDPGEDGWLVVGRDNTVHVASASVACVDSIELEGPSGAKRKVSWKVVRPSELSLTLPLKDAQPGGLTLLLGQYGVKRPEALALRAFAEPGRLAAFTLHAGDSQGVLSGSRLDEVASLAFEGVTFVPGRLATSLGTDELTMTATVPSAAAAAALAPGAGGPARVTLTDGRVRSLEVIVSPPRPSVALLGKSVEPTPSGFASHIELDAPDELPAHAVLAFSVRAESPATFARDEQLVVATADGSSSTTLTLANGGLTLASASVAVATLDPAKAFGPSVFGPLRFRVVLDGALGDWQPLATLVRLPRLVRLTCPATRELACKLSGGELFLVDALSTDRTFHHAVEVPDGFPGDALPVPHPVDGLLYLRLRDDPSAVDRATLAVEQLPPTPQEAARAATRRAAAQPEARLPSIPAESPYPADLFSGRAPAPRPAPSTAKSPPPGSSSHSGR